MIKVKALKNFEKVIDNTIGRPRKEGETWEVSEDRLKTIQKFTLPLVEVVEDVRTASLEKRAEKKIVRRKKAVQK